MPLMPKRVKFRKFQRGSLKGKAQRADKVDFGDFGLQSLERDWHNDIFLFIRQSSIGVNQWISLP
mgnify:CR=1 FL=1